MLENFYSHIWSFNIVINDKNLDLGWIESVIFRINCQANKYVIHTETDKYVDKIMKEGLHNLTVLSIVHNPFPVAR